MAILKLAEGSYANKNVVENTMRYITRTRKEENRRNELLVYGSPNVTCFPGEDGIRQAISEFKTVQTYLHYPLYGRRVFHEIFCFSEEERYGFQRIEQINDLALTCSKVYDHLGFQVIYAVHYSEEKKLHIHFVGNAVSYVTGNKYHTSLNDKDEREIIFNNLYQEHIYKYNLWSGAIRSYYGSYLPGMQSIWTGR